MSELEVVARKIADETLDRLKPSIPIKYALWSTKEIGEYRQRPAQVVCERIVCLPRFPEAIRLPNIDGGWSFPRWKAAEVIECVESHQGCRRGRPRKKT